MRYDVGYTGRVSIVGDSKRDAVAKVQLLVNGVLNFDPSASCSAYIINRRGDEGNDQDEPDGG